MLTDMFSCIIVSNLYDNIPYGRIANLMKLKITNKYLNPMRNDMWIPLLLRL